MTIYLPALAVVLLSMLGLSVGVLVRGRPLMHGCPRRWVETRSCRGCAHDRTQTGIDGRIGTEET